MNDKIEVSTKSPEEFNEESRHIALLSKTNILKTAESATTLDANPWTAEEVDKYATKDVTKEYRATVNSCRFFYRRDPLASVIVNKMVEVAISELQLISGNVPANQFRVYESLIDDLQDFAEDSALEYLISGLLIPEIELVRMPKRELTLRGIKAYPSLYLPASLWVRDPATIIIDSPLIANDLPTYYVEIPDELIHFIKNKGKYKNGNEDKELYQELLRLYPDFVRKVLSGDTKLKLDVDMAIRRKTLSDSPYPTPFLYPALESLRHKRNIRRMDYSLASRVITAIQLVKVGNDEYPLTAEDDQQLEYLRAQMRWRDTNNREIERIFQLFTNHTVTIEWVFPDVTALLDEKKYTNVNSDIMNAFGFPKILITGETDRSQTSDASIAMISPEKTLENIRRKVIRVIRKVIQSVADENGFREVPEIRFSPMNLRSFSEFLQGIQYLYDSGNLSRTDLAKALGYDFEEQIKSRADENKLITKLNVPEFAPVPHSNTPQTGTDGEKNTDKDDNTTDETEEK